MFQSGFHRPKVLCSREVVFGQVDPTADLEQEAAETIDDILNSAADREIEGERGATHREG